MFVKTTVIFCIMLTTSASWACDLRINNADAVAKNIVSYFERKFPHKNYNCDEKNAETNCKSSDKEVNVNFNKQVSLDVAILSASTSRINVGILRELWMEIRSNVNFGDFREPSEVAVSAAIDGSGPRIFIQKDHCGLVFDHKPEGSTFVVMGGWRK